jgi:hypothetical protein
MFEINASSLHLSPFAQKPEMSHHLHQSANAAPPTHPSMFTLRLLLQRPHFNQALDPLPADLNDAYTENGIVGLLRALQSTHGAELFDVVATFLALRKPFSKVSWDEVEAFFGLGSDPFDNWEDIGVPRILLPTSIIQELVAETLKAVASLGPISELRNEAATASFLSGVRAIWFSLGDC